MNKIFLYIRFLLLSSLFLGYFRVNSNVKDFIWSIQELNSAEKAAIKFISALKIKDMITICEQISYPMELTDMNGNRFEFTKQEEFLSFEFDKLLSEKFVNTIINSNPKEMFSSWRGFMLGDGANTVWFSPDEKGVWLIYGIVAGDQLPIKIVK